MSSWGRSVDQLATKHKLKRQADHFAETHHLCSAGRSLFFSWTFNFVIDNFSRFRKRLGRGWTWVRGGKLQSILVVYGHDDLYISDLRITVCAPMSPCDQMATIRLSFMEGLIVKIIPMQNSALHSLA